MRIPREVSWAASNSTETLNPFLRRPSEKLGRKRYVLPVTSDGVDRDLVSYKSGDEGSSLPPRPSGRGLPGNRVACRHRRGSHRCLVLPGALDIRAPHHAAFLRSEFGKHPPVLWRMAGPRGTSVWSEHLEHWRRVFRSLRFHGARLGRIFREARRIGESRPSTPRGFPDSADERTFPLLLSQDQVAVSELVPPVSVRDRFPVRLHDAR